MAKSLEDAGIPLEGVAAAIQRGALFARLPRRGRLRAVRDSQRRDVPAGQRQDRGPARAADADPRGDRHGATIARRFRLREDEMAIVPFLELQIAEGFRPPAIERLFRSPGQKHRSDCGCGGGLVELRGDRAGCGRGQGPGGDRERRPLRSISPLSQQASARHVPRAAGACLDRQHHRRVRDDDGEGGIHSRLERVPAICFLDITGYTRLTQERGRRRGRGSGRDRRAARAAQLRATTAGRPIKWLGDGVMFYFRDPGPGVRAALEMVDGLQAAGLPPAHVGSARGAGAVPAGRLLRADGQPHGRASPTTRGPARCWSATSSPTLRRRTGSRSARSARWSSRAYPEPCSCSGPTSCDARPRPMKSPELLGRRDR